MMPTLGLSSFISDFISEENKLLQIKSQYNIPTILVCDFINQITASYVELRISLQYILQGMITDPGKVVLRIALYMHCILAGNIRLISFLFVVNYVCM